MPRPAVPVTMPSEPGDTSMPLGLADVHQSVSSASARSLRPPSVQLSFTMTCASADWAATVARTAAISRVFARVFMISPPQETALHVNEPPCTSTKHHAATGYQLTQPAHDPVVLTEYRERGGTHESSRDAHNMVASGPPSAGGPAQEERQQR